MDSLTFNTDIPYTTLEVDLGDTTLSTISVDTRSSTIPWDETTWPPTGTTAPTLPTSLEPTDTGDNTWTTVGSNVTDVPSVTVTKTVNSPSEDDLAATTTSANDGDDKGEEGLAAPRVQGSVALSCSLLFAAAILCILLIN